MPENNSNQLPLGLPACLTAEPNGFDAFCRLLKINSRADKQYILKIVYDKSLLKNLGILENQHQKTSVRFQHNLISSFSIPKLRVSLWKLFFRQTDGFTKPSNSKNVSLEYLAIREYETNFSEIAVDKKELENCSSFFEYGASLEDWKKPALALLPAVYADLLDWQSLTPERKKQTLLAAFSISTLIEDSRLLSWAVNNISGFDIEMEFLVEYEKSKTIDNAKFSHESEEIGESLTDTGTKDELVKLEKACSKLSNVALNLSRGPYSENLFDQIARHAEHIDRLREPVLRITSAEEAEILIDSYCKFLRTQYEHVPWLAAKVNEIQSGWRKYHFDESERILDEGKIRKDIEKSKQDIERSLRKWNMADTELNRANASLSEFQNQLLPSDYDITAQSNYMKSQDQCFKDVASARQKDFELKRKVINGAFPYDDQYLLQEKPSQQTEKAQEDGNSDKIQDPTVKEQESENLQTSTPLEIKKTVPSEDETDVAKTENLKAGSEYETPEKIPERASKTTSSGITTAVESEEEVPQLRNQYELAAWDAIADNQIGLAYHIAKLRQEVEDDNVIPSQELLAALAFRGILHSPEEPATQKFSEFAELALARINFDDSAIESKDATNLLLFSASLHPALFASNTSAIQMLKNVELSGELSAVSMFVAKVADHAQKLQSVHFSLSRLRSMHDVAAWEKRLRENKEHVQQWLQTARIERYAFEPCNRVWSSWLSQHGILSRLADLVSKGEETSVPTVRNILENFAEPKKFTNLVDTTGRQELEKTHFKSMPQHARIQLERHSKKPVELANEWIQLVKSKPDCEGYEQDIVSALCSDVTEQAPNTLKNIADVLQKNPETALRAALLQAERSIDILIKFLEHDFDSVEKDVSSEFSRVLFRDILNVTSLNIGANGSFENQISPQDALNALTDKDSHAQNLVDAFWIRLKRGNIAGAQAVLEQMVIEGDSSQDQCQVNLDQAVSMMQIELGYELDELNGKLERAYTVGRFSEDEFSILDAKIVEARELCKKKKSVIAASGNIAGFKSEIEEKFNESIEGVKSQLGRFLPLNDSREQAFVNEALENQDLIALNEQLYRLQNGEQLLPLSLDPHETLEDFLSKVANIDEHIDSEGDNSFDETIDFVLQNEEKLGLNFSALTPAQLRKAIRLLELWYEMAKHGKADRTKIFEFMDHLGFSVKECKIRSDNSVRIGTEPLRSRELCPVSAFGSDAEGHYNIVLNWRSPPQEKIVQLVGENRSQCSIVLHFGRLMESREWLANWSIQNQILFLIIDESLILYLSSLQSGVLRALFDCSLPFTCVKPFYTAAGYVPPESFYGREDEQKRIIDRRGSCFVYGGRQLGKTALLRSVEASFNRSETNYVAIYLDLKVWDVGVAYGAEYLWNVLWKKLQEYDIIEEREHVPNGRDRLVEKLTNFVKTWLSNGKSFRILLLLDEADAFLISDFENDFRESTRLKGLMDETDRKFKVVFSGLHNVLRTTESANHPLAHFGEPICVGPLLSNGELERARALLLEPLAAVGYKFEKESLTTRILGRTNYYPSLIQLCGTKLVRYLRDEYSVRRYPHSIAQDDIEVLFSRDGLRDLIVQRFLLTLRLDPRYEVITYGIALELQGDNEGLTKGLSPFKIFEITRYWWSRGFEITQNEFNSLLDEMCGLGVLRKCRIEGGEVRYTFRNPNVFLLLGEPSEIEGVLTKEHELTVTFEASSHHARFPDDVRHDSVRRGPLSFEQESKLKRKGGVTVISGSDAADVSAIGEFLSQRMDSKNFRVLKLCTDEASMEKQLTRQRPTGRNIHVYMIPSESPWTIRWIQRAASVLKRVKRGRSMQIVFPADPQQLWTLVSELADDYLEDSSGPFEWMNILPWNRTFLSHWCADQGLQAKPKVDNLLELSGGWPCVLENYAEFDETNWKSSEQFTRSYIEANREILLEKMGLGTDKLQNEIKIFQDYEAFSSDDVRAAIEMINEEDETYLNKSKFVRRLWWAKHLGLIQNFQGSWHLNSLLRHIL